MGLRQTRFPHTVFPVCRGPRLKLIDWVYLVLALVGTAWVVITFLNDR